MNVMRNLVGGAREEDSTSSPIPGQSVEAADTVPANNGDAPDADAQARKKKLEAKRREEEGQAIDGAGQTQRTQATIGGSGYQTGSQARKPSNPLGIIPPLSSQTSEHLTRSSSPGLPSAASSLIFERNVQESTLSSDDTPGIPAHIKTEDQIPPALEASSLAITDNHLGPDEVEIVTHTGHQPAASIIAESIPSAHPFETHLPLSPQSHHEPTLSPTSEGDDTASNYGALDPNDVRRLSFISFADVVHAEHAETASIHSAHHNLPTSATSEMGFSQTPSANRPISPTRSGMSSASQPYNPELTTPPTSVSGPGSAKGAELSPVASHATSPTQHGELSIETLGQALRKTASRDLSGFKRSPPSSAV